MSTTQAFSPGPTITRGPLVGRVFRWILVLLYEQCSENRAEAIPSSTILIGRPSALMIASNSPAFNPWERASSGDACRIHGEDDGCEGLCVAG